MSSDGSEQGGGSYGGGPGLGHNKDVGAAAGLRSRADQTSPAGSGRAVHQKQHIAAQQSSEKSAEEGVETLAQGSNKAEA